MAGLAAASRFPASDVQRHCVAAVLVLCTGMGVSLAGRAPGMDTLLHSFGLYIPEVHGFAEAPITPAWSVQASLHVVSHHCS